MTDRHTVGKAVWRGIVLGGFAGGLLWYGATRPPVDGNAPPADGGNRPAHAWCAYPAVDGTLALNAEINAVAAKRYRHNPTEPIDYQQIRQTLLDEC